MLTGDDTAEYTGEYRDDTAEYTEEYRDDTQLFLVSYSDEYQEMVFGTLSHSVVLITSDVMKRTQFHKGNPIVNTQLDSSIFCSTFCD